MTIRLLDIHNPSQALNVLALQMKAYLLEAEIIGFTDIPPLKDSILTLQFSGETFVGYEEKGELAGVIAYTLSDDTLTVCRMMVHPDHHRKGIGSKLLSYVLDAHTAVPRMLVTTGTANAPAVRLYAKHGFLPRTKHLIAPGITLTEMVRDNRPAASAETI